MPLVFYAAMKMLKRAQALILILFLSASNCKMLFNSGLGHRLISSRRLAGKSSPGVQVVLNIGGHVTHMMCDVADLADISAHPHLLSYRESHMAPIGLRSCSSHQLH